VEQWPVVGRDAELRRLRVLVTERTGAVLAGPAGVGKTTLARACAAQAEADGMAVAIAVATKAASAWPFGALAPLLPAETETVEPGDESRLLRRYATAIVERAGDRDLLLFVDDAHHLDDASATLLHQLAHTKAATVLVTLRSGMRAPDPITSLWKDGWLERVDLGVLDGEIVAELLIAVLGGPVRAQTANLFADACRGNPLFLRELVLGAVNAGDLEQRDGVWQLLSVLHPSSRLADLVDERLGRLEPAEHELLELVALYEPFGAKELDTLVDHETVEALERKAIITSRLDGRRLQIWLSHPIYGEATRSRIPAARRRALVRRRADVLETTGHRRRDDDLLLARWRLDGGGGRPEELEAGARASRARNAHELTWRMATAALDAGAGFGARLLAAEAAFLMGDAPRVDAHLPELRASARSEVERAQVAALTADASLFLHGRADLAAIEELEPTVTDPHWRDELRSRRLNALWMTEGPGAIARASEPLLDEHGAPMASFSYLVGAMGFGFQGRIDDALRLVERTTHEAPVTSTATPWWKGTRGNVLVLLLTRAGRTADARAIAEPLYAAAVAEDDVELTAFAGCALARVHLAQGRVRTAAAEARESAGIFNDLGRMLLVADPLITCAQASALVGDIGAADGALEHLVKWNVPAVPDQTDRMEAEAWIALAKGDAAAARRLLARAGNHGERLGDLTGAARAWHSLARLGDVARARPRLESLGSRVEGELMTARLAHVAALESQAPDELERAAEAFERIGRNLEAAEAMCEAAEAFARAGFTREATATGQHASRLNALCEGAVTPTLRAFRAPAGLAEGELAAARLAADGRSNREIADELRVSVRTVENRLQRVYEKLGVASRRSLAAALDQHPARS